MIPCVALIVKCFYFSVPKVNATLCITAIHRPVLDCPASRDRLPLLFCLLRLLTIVLPVYR